MGMGQQGEALREGIANTTRDTQRNYYKQLKKKSSLKIVHTRQLFECCPPSFLAGDLVVW